MFSTGLAQMTGAAPGMVGSGIAVCPCLHNVSFGACGTTTQEMQMEYRSYCSQVTSLIPNLVVKSHLLRGMMFILSGMVSQVTRLCGFCVTHSCLVCETRWSPTQLPHSWTDLKLQGGAGG